MLHLLTGAAASSTSERASSSLPSGLTNTRGCNLECTKLFQDSAQFDDFILQIFDFFDALFNITTVNIGWHAAARVPHHFVFWLDFHSKYSFHGLKRFCQFTYATLKLKFKNGLSMFDQLRTAPAEGKFIATPSSTFVFCYACGTSKNSNGNVYIWQLSSYLVY